MFLQCYLTCFFIWPINANNANVWGTLVLAQKSFVLAEGLSRISRHDFLRRTRLNHDVIRAESSHFCFQVVASQRMISGKILSIIGSPGVKIASMVAMLCIWLIGFSKFIHCFVLYSALSIISTFCRHSKISCKVLYSCCLSNLEILTLNGFSVYDM